MPLASWNFFLHEAWTSIRRHGPATLTTMLLCIASLTALGLFVALIINVNQVTLGFLSSMELVAFLEPQVSTVEANQLQLELTRHPAVAEITFVSKEEAYQKASELLQFPVNEMLGEGNPFPASLEIKAVSPEAMEPLQRYVQRVPGVEEVQVPNEKALTFMFYLQAIAFFLTLILAAITLFTIKSTIALAILSRRTEIRVMRLVGATPSFVRVPFLLEGLAYGAVGALVAWMIVMALYATTTGLWLSENPLAVITPFRMVAFNEALVLGAIGMLMGILGALVSVDRHLTEKYIHSSAPGAPVPTHTPSRLTPVTVALLLLALVLPINGSQAAPDPEDAAQQAEMEEQLRALEQEKGAAKRVVNEVRGERRSALSALNAVDADLMAARGRLDSLQAQLDRQTSEMNRTKGQYERTQQEFTIAQARLALRLRSWYKGQRRLGLDFILDAQGLQDLTYRARYAEAALEADRRTLQFIQEQGVLLEETRLAVEREMAATKVIADQVDAERANYAALRDEKATVLNGVNRDLRQAESALAELEAESVNIEYELAALKGGGSVDFTGAFIHPLPGRRISSPFGVRMHPILRRRKMHTGLDIPAPAGTPIRAAAPGVVFFSGWRNGYGRCVIINHGQGMATLYGHMSSIKMSQGQTVAAGAVVGGVGQTGLATGNHLHFEIRKNGTPINPSQYI